MKKNKSEEIKFSTHNRKVQNQHLSAPIRRTKAVRGSVTIVRFFDSTVIACLVDYEVQ